MEEADPQIENVVKLARAYRQAAAAGGNFGLREGPGPTLTIKTAKLIKYGLPPLIAIQVGMINPLTHEHETKKSLYEIATDLFEE